MLYLIQSLWPFLLLCAGFAAVAGWALFAERAAPRAEALRREREQLLDDLAKLAAGEEGFDARIEEQRAAAARESKAAIREARIAELERNLEAARTRADAEAAEAARARQALEAVQTAALAPLAAQPAVSEDGPAALQGWRLRYFEQRVRYLESQASPPRAAAALTAAPLAPEWRAREAEARAAFLSEEVRRLSAPAPAAATAAPDTFAGNMNVDMLLRWRMLYLERRVHHLQAVAHETVPQPLPRSEPAPGPAPAIWHWRARYLEARIRELERAQMGAVTTPDREPLSVAREAEPPPAPQAKAQRPHALAAARNGAPDDFTLIEDVSALQQSTLNALGIFHFDQIAAWTPEHVAWVDAYLRLRGRIDEEEWIEQAAALAREGVGAARRDLVSEDA